MRSALTSRRLLMSGQEIVAGAEDEIIEGFKLIDLDQVDGRSMECAEDMLVPQILEMGEADRLILRDRVSEWVDEQERVQNCDVGEAVGDGNVKGNHEVSHETEFGVSGEWK